MTLPSQHSRFDCHMHTPLCGHAIGDPIDYVEAAAARGISLITFTCHIPMKDSAFAQEGIRMREADLPHYRALVQEAREHGREIGVEVLYGIEAEIYPDPSVMREMEKLLEAEAFDFVLGSLHHMLPAFRSWMKTQGMNTDEKRVTAYFDCLAEGAASGRYHSLSHPDVIRIYGTLEEMFDPRTHEAAITRFLDAVAAAGTCLEINTSGLIKGDYVVHPDPLIMEWALERKIPFTIGSDAHAPNMVGQHFEETIAEFKERGLDKLHYFRAGQRVAVEI